jgi:hypothetical protein
VPATLVPLTPDWWTERLYNQLVTRQSSIEHFTNYYTGHHPLPWLAPQAREEFRRVLAMTRSNYMGLVCDALAEPITIEGFRFGEDEPSDREAWRIWQANNLDSDSDQAILESFITGSSYLLVAPNPQDDTTPRVWVEHPSQAIVEFAPGSARRDRSAGLKVWDDDWTGEVHATLYLAEFIYKYRAKRPTVGMQQGPRWERREIPQEDWPARNPLGVVPLIELPNAPRLLTGGVSELADITDVQDRINKTLADRLITQDYGAFPQKWAVAWPQYQDDERTILTPPIDVGRDRMVTTEVAETKFGQWDAAPLDPYSAAKREDVKDIAARKRIPADYLLGELNNVNGATLVASRAGMVAVVRQRCRAFAESFEEAMRLALRTAGRDVPTGMRMETVFSNPEFRTVAELTDATVKKLQAGIISVRQAREDLGYTQTQIAALEQDDVRERTDPTLERLARDLTSPGAAAASIG